MQQRLSSSVKVFYPRYKRSELVELLRKRMPLLAAAIPLKRVVLFGSWAVGRQTAFSDVDLMVVYAGPFREGAYRLVRQKLNVLGLEPHVFSEEDVQEFGPVIQRMTREGIVLFPLTSNDTVVSRRKKPEKDS